MTQAIQERLNSIVTEALDLRHGEAEDGSMPRLPHQLEGQEEVLSSLVRVRQRLDRIEELNTSIIRLRAGLIKKRDDIKFETEFKYHEEIRKDAAKQIEFRTGAAQRAEASLNTFNEKRKEYEADRLVAEASTVAEVVSQCYWGLNRLREDHLAVLRSFSTFETKMERTGDRPW